MVSPAELELAAIDAARAGAECLDSWRNRFVAREKGPADLVTEADLASQQAVADLLAARFPDHAFIGEETGLGGVNPAPGQVCWVVDPLDGTTNYVHGFPSYGVSVAAVMDGAPVAAALCFPPTGETFHAALGGGAWLNDAPARVSRAQGLETSLVGMSLPPQVTPTSPDVLDFVSVVPRCHGVRRLGSAAMSLAYVACGRLDAYWARQIYPWDVAAGVLLIREAGGVVTSASGGTFDLWQADLVATASESLNRSLCRVLAG